MALVTERAAGSSGLCKVSKQVSIVKPTRCTNVSNFTVHTARVPAPHSHSHHYQCRTPYAAVHTLILLMMGIMMPETCWDKSLIINNRLVASCWFLSLYPTLMIILYWTNFNPLNTELSPVCHLLALLGAHHIFHVSGLRVKHKNR